MTTQFTTANQVSNVISVTTTQTVKHNFYSNITVTISGRYNSNKDCSVWVNTGSRMSRKFEALNLDQAIIEANKLINS
jgi:hypothetical protein